MTNEEKLKHFLEMSIESATNQSTKLIDDYTKALEKIFEEHKTDMQRKADLQLRLGRESLEREMNKELSHEQIQIKREATARQAEIKDMLFNEVAGLLKEYKATSSYQQLLIRQIKEAVALAGDDEIIIYIDPSDTARLHNLEADTQTSLRVSETEFMGGICAVIKSRNLFIDNSFETQLKEAKEAFTFINK